MGGAPVTEGDGRAFPSCSSQLRCLIGAADALLAELARIAAVEGWSAVRWNTAENNYRARALYDRHSTRTVFLTYLMEPNES